MKCDNRTKNIINQNNNFETNRKTQPRHSCCDYLLFSIIRLTNSSFIDKHKKTTRINDFF